MAADPAGQLVGAAIERLAVAGHRQRAAQAALLGIRPADVLALRYLARAGELTPGELAGILLLSPGGAAAVVDRLQRRGLVERRPGPGGRRRILLALSADGRAVVAPTAASLAAAVDNLLAEVSSGPRTELERILGRLADLYESHADRLVADAAAAGAAASGAPSPVLWG